tara:strand:+ start:239 stop:631 length:393 start_codon:yes stop_codon:yes gene_type:complete
MAKMTREEELAFVHKHVMNQMALDILNLDWTREKFIEGANPYLAKGVDPIIKNHIKRKLMMQEALVKLGCRPGSFKISFVEVKSGRQGNVRVAMSVKLKHENGEKLIKKAMRMLRKEDAPKFKVRYNIPS